MTALAVLNQNTDVVVEMSYENMHWGTRQFISHAHPDSLNRISEILIFFTPTGGRKSITLQMSSLCRESSFVPVTIFDVKTLDPWVEEHISLVAGDSIYVDMNKIYDV